MSSLLRSSRPTTSLQVETAAQRLHDLAHQVERLGVGGRTDPETVVLGKLTIARDLRRIAKELDR